MKSRLLGGIAALVLAIIGTALLVVYVQGADSRAAQGLNPVKVLVVNESIPAGTKVEDLAGKLKLEDLPQSAVPAAALASLEEQGGKVTASALQPGEQLLAAKLVSPKELVPGTVPVPDGMEEVTFLLAPERILGGRLEAGDLVTVFSSFKTDDKGNTGLLFHDVLVTAVQKAEPDSSKTSSSPSDSAVAMPNGSAFVTVARSDAEAAKMVFSAEFGTLWLSKQTDKTNKTQPPVMTQGGLYQ
ncbi:Flp pilus assembly protein CpaB [Pseudarthrobacter sp. NIBRBAC000502771]|uniref:Flp pilus assembly protein CpaB n=1 Tax=Pseudarthrobacter sp. NIBRBAC000502771 TaxID=2590774 RepID=UPI00113031CF|nr:RcpC/CpaB family pilus assembly protein [Pseudarthrobacter sp. NIBRBAC000502771]QDG62814.1 pilus assembly protein CpaB [Pseudarthrobacter sp. NIBRBAC000502771]